MVTVANRQLHRLISQNPQNFDDTTGSLASQNSSTSTEKQRHPNKQIAIAMEKLDNKNSYPLLFHAKATTLPPLSLQKTVGEPSGTTH